MIAIASCGALRVACEVGNLWLARKCEKERPSAAAGRVQAAWPGRLRIDGFHTAVCQVVRALVAGSNPESPRTDVGLDRR